MHLVVIVSMQCVNLNSPAELVFNFKLKKKMDVCPGISQASVSILIYSLYS